MKPSSISDRFVEQIRKATDGRPPLSMLGRHVERRPIGPDEYGRVAGEWVGVQAPRRHVLYLHGGYYIAGRPSTYANLAARLASGTAAAVLLIDYRLAPETPYPAALDDAFDAYQGLLDTGVDPAAVAVAGDSAGGGLALALLQRVRAEGLPMPGAAVLFSPWVDLTCSGTSIDTNDETDDMLSAAALRTAAAFYAGTFDLHTPGISPLFGDLSGLPPLFVTVDNSETLLDDSLRLVDRCRSVGGRAVLHQDSGLFHVWPITVPYVREARRTIADVVSFLDRELA